MKTLLQLHPHSGCSTAERENYFRSIELLVFEYFSSRSLCYMRIRKRRRIHENLLTVGKRTSLPWYSTCMCLHHVYGIYSTYVSLYHIYVSTPHLYVYPPPRVYSTFTCLLYIHVYPISTCLPYLYISNPVSNTR